jgi:cytochrome o ubiquinol oxidase subunit IV
VLAIAQMGVHLVFFLHITTGPDNTNNVLALAFGVLIVILLMGDRSGSWRTSTTT